MFFCFFVVLETTLHSVRLGGWQQRSHAFSTRKQQALSLGGRQTCLLLEGRHLIVRISRHCNRLLSKSPAVFLAIVSRVIWFRVGTSLPLTCSFRSHVDTHATQVTADSSVLFAVARPLFDGRVLVCVWRRLCFSAPRCWCCVCGVIHSVDSESVETFWAPGGVRITLAAGCNLAGCKKSSKFLFRHQLP